MVGNQLPFPRSVPVCLVPGSCSVFPVLAPFWHTDGTVRVLVALVLAVFVVGGGSQLGTGPDCTDAVLGRSDQLARHVVHRRYGLHEHLGVEVTPQLPARGNEVRERIGNTAHVASR